jgi:arginine decarboxylase
MPNVTNKDSYCNISNWSETYFSIDKQGDVVICLNDKKIKFTAIQKLLKQEKISYPCLIEFPDIPNDRVKKINNSFEKAFAHHNYKGSYNLVYPIKVNQKFNVVSDLYNQNPSIGLESGSKAELCAILSIANPSQSLIVCNGYKDSDYLELAFLASNLGYKVYIVVEKISEVDKIVSLTKIYEKTPDFGVRARLSTVDDAKGQSYSGIRAKFGLSSSDILKMIEVFKNNKLLNKLTKMHCHMGTQLGNLHNIYQGVAEATMLYTHLIKLGANLQTINLGGGLAIDYDGTKSTSHNSKNYDLDQYAWHIVHAVQKVCKQNNCTEPNIFTESGRGIMAHGSVFLFQLIDKDPIDEFDTHQINIPILNKLKDIYVHKELRDTSITYKDTLFELNKIQQEFASGQASLQEKAQAEALAFSILKSIQGKNISFKEKLDVLLANKYYGNLSIFRSLPDIWAIDQIFPMIPLVNLNDDKTQNAVIADITCDSDGAFYSYVNEEVKVSLSLPKSTQILDVLGVFLVGAYQDILGDDHNLYGRTNCVRVCLKKEPKILKIIKNHSVSSTLKDVHYDKKQLIEALTKQNEISNKSAFHAKFKEIINKILEGTTYLNVE